MKRGGGKMKQDILEAAIKLGEQHLQDKINLLNLIERALAQLKRSPVQVGRARALLELAVKEVKIGDV